MKIVSMTSLALLLALSQPSFAAEHQTPEVQQAQHEQGEIIEGQHQQAGQQEAGLEVTQAEVRSLQVIHLSNLTQIAAQFLGASRLTDASMKQAALDAVRKYGQWEMELVALAREFEIELSASDADIVAIKEKNQEFLTSLVQLPGADFQISFQEQISMHQSDLAAFLEAEMELGYNHTEIQDFVSKVLADIQLPEEGETVN